MHSTDLMVKIGNIKQYGLVVILLLISVAVFYFSWIPDSHFTSESYLPVWLRDWSNSYFNLRTAIPFVAFGFLLEALFSEKNKLRNDENKFSSWFKNIFIATAVVCLAEGGQFFILNRHPDLMDVVFGILGSQIGAVVFHLLKNFRTFLIFKP